MTCLSEDSVAVELMNKAAVSYSAIVSGRTTRVPPVAVRSTRGPKDLLQIADRIAAAVRKHFGVSLAVADLVLEAMATFSDNKSHYLRVFAKYRPTAVVCVDNGSLKDCSLPRKK